MTTEELFKFYAEPCNFEEGPTEYLIDKESFVEALKKFAKMHIKKALEIVDKRAENEFGEKSWDLVNDKNFILNAYPETLIQ